MARKSILEQVNAQIERTQTAIEWMNESEKKMIELGEAILSDKCKLSEYHEAASAWEGWQWNVYRELKKLSNLIGITVDLPRNCTPYYMRKMFRNICWQWAPIEALLKSLHKEQTSAVSKENI